MEICDACKEYRLVGSNTICNQKDNPNGCGFKHLREARYHFNEWRATCRDAPYDDPIIISPTSFALQRWIVNSLYSRVEYYICELCGYGFGSEHPSYVINSTTHDATLDLINKKVSEHEEVCILPRLGPKSATKMH